LDQNWASPTPKIERHEGPQESSPGCHYAGTQRRPDRDGRFAGLGHEEIAAALGITVYLARQKWTHARAWLGDVLGG